MSQGSQGAQSQGAGTENDNGLPVGDLGIFYGVHGAGCRFHHHRRLIERLDRRGQQVWIPVTVATLVPGAIFLSIPFIEALRLFTAS